MPIHVFIDNSNVYGGAQRAARTIEPTVLDRAVRIYYRNIFQLVEEARPALTRVLAGSVPPGNDKLWRHARAGGYDTDLLRRVEHDDGRLLEQGVDELLHLKIANALLDHNPPDQTLVVVSGDGRTSDFNTGFVLQAERALRRGWQVEIWSWKEQLTGAYDRLCHDHLGKIIVRVLDPYYSSLTFVRSGEFGIGGGAVAQQATERVVAPLPGQPPVQSTPTASGLGALAAALQEAGLGRAPESAVEVPSTAA